MADKIIANESELENVNGGIIDLGCVNVTEDSADATPENANAIYGAIYGVNSII